MFPKPLFTLSHKIILTDNLNQTFEFSTLVCPTSAKELHTALQVIVDENKEHNINFNADLQWLLFATETYSLETLLLNKQVHIYHMYTQQCGPAFASAW